MTLPTLEQAQGIALIIGALGALIVSVGTFIMQWRAGHKLTSIQEDGTARTAQITQVHDLVNGQSAALLSLTAKASKAEGVKDERDAADQGTHA